jgi:hypothetical protein
MYFWHSCGLLPSNIVYFPGGSGAGKNNILISFAIGLASSYIALFDGDKAGEDAIVRYEEIFSEDEKVHWLKYEKPNGVPCKLEELISKADGARIKTITGASSVKKSISSLYYMDKSKKKEFWGKLDSESIGNITHNAEKFEAALAALTKA